MIKWMLRWNWDTPTSNKPSPILKDYILLQIVFLKVIIGEISEYCNERDLSLGI